MIDLSLGSRFIVEPEGTLLTELEHIQLAKLSPAGVMLRSRNFKGSAISGVSASYEEMLETLSKLLQDIRQASKRKNIFVAIDHEGGRVVRPPLPITHMPYPAFWGDSLADVVRVFATELKSLGINLIFGPVSDIHSNPANPVIAERAFGRTKEEVIPKILSYLEIMQQEGLLCCAKHFPGHGNTSTDSHFELPVLQYSKQQLKDAELAPFKAIIEADVPMVMSAHISLPNIDSALPATLSYEIMYKILREDLGFTGVSIADALAMKAIVDMLPTPEFAQQVLKAEVDLLCVVGPGVSIATALMIAENLEKAISTDSELSTSHQNSIARVEALLANTPQYTVHALDETTLAHNHSLAEKLKLNVAWTTSSEKQFIPEGF